MPTLQVVATHLPPEEIEGIRQMFIDMDKDGSGTISFEELREGQYEAMGWVPCHQMQCQTATVQAAYNHHSQQHTPAII